MLNIRTLDVLLRAFDADALATRPAAAVDAVGAASAVGARIASPAVALLQAALEDVEAASQAFGDGSATARAGTDANVVAGSARRLVATNAPTPDVEREQSVARSGTTPQVSAPLRLSDAARLVGELVRETGVGDEQATVRGATPLLPAPTLNAEPLARALAAAIANSGLFYEAHLAQWALQQRPQAELANEPQAAWSHDVATGGAQLPAEAPGDSSSPVLQPGNPHSDAALPLVRDQLHALETRQVAWDGEIWPGQGAKIRIAQDEQGNGGADAPPWRTHLTLQLSSLGQLDVMLSLQGDSLRLQVHTQDAASADALLASRQELVAAMQQRSLAVSGLSIAHERNE